VTATATPERTVVGAPRGRRRFTGTGLLVAFALRRDRVRLPAWIAGVALFVTYVATAIPAVYGEEPEDLEAMAGALLADPMGRLLTGPGYGMGDLTLERLIAGGYGLYFLVLAALMSILLVSRHTRVEEQTGRAELLRANVVGRHAPLTAAFIVAVITNVLVGGVAGLAMIAFGSPTTGSVLFGASLLATGLAFAGLTAVTVQLAENSRPASGMAGAVLGLAFVLRGAGDAAEQGGSLLSWFSPLGWAQQTAPYVLDRWWPLLLLGVFAVTTAALGAGLSARRDVGMSLFATRPGPAYAARWVRSATTLSLRLQRNSLGWWALALAISGLMYGGFTETMLEAFADLPEAMVELMGAQQDMAAGYLSFMAFFQALLVGIYAILSVQTLRNEETSGRVEPVLATPTSRRAWAGGHLVVSALGVLGLLAIVGATTGATAWAVTGDAGHLGPAIAGHVVQAPAVLVLLGVAALLFGVASRLVPLAWLLLGYALFAGVFGQLMELPDWVYGISPFEHPPQMPLEEFALAPVVALSGLAIALGVSGLFALRRRGIGTG
jgi:ABC-2 type transport system permease protein